MTPSRRLIFLLPLALLAACRGAPETATPAPPSKPIPLGFSLGVDGALTISGRADANDRLLVNDAPAGQADAAGAWRLTWPQTDAARRVKLTAERDGSKTEAGGPLVLLPGRAGAVLLTPGGGSQRLIESGRGIRMLAIDYDGQGGMVVSGRATAEADIRVRMDSVAVGRGIADSDGRFSIGVDRAVRQGGHVVEISGGAGQEQRSVTLGPPAGGFNLRPTPFGWRLDWTTMAGGAQVTLLFDPAK